MRITARWLITRGKPLEKAKMDELSLESQTKALAATGRVSQGTSERSASSTA